MKRNSIGRNDLSPITAIFLVPKGATVEAKAEILRRRTTAHMLGNKPKFNEGNGGEKIIKHSLQQDYPKDDCDEDELRDRNGGSGAIHPDIGMHTSRTDNELGEQLNLESGNSYLGTRKDSRLSKKETANVREELNRARLKLEKMSERHFQELCQYYDSWFGNPVTGSNRAEKVRFILSTDPLASDGGLLDFLHENESLAVASAFVEGFTEQVAANFISASQKD